MCDEPPLFDWDSDNRQHIARHKVLPEEVEQAILDPYALFLEIQIPDGEERTKAVGSTSRTASGGDFFVSRCGD